MSCRSGDMFILDGSLKKKFALYPPAKTMIEVENEEWIHHDNDIKTIFTIA